MKKLFGTREQIVGNSLAIFSMVAPSFNGVNVVLSGDVVNSIFRTNLIIFVKDLPKYSCDG